MFIECRHVLPRGTKCKSPALRGRVYCYFHDRLLRYEQDGQRVEREPLFLPSIEDARGVQMAVTQVLAALGSGRVETRQAGLYLYGLQLATQLLAQLPETFPQEMVRALTAEDGNYIAEEEIPFAPAALPSSAPSSAPSSSRLLEAPDTATRNTSRSAGPKSRSAKPDTAQADLNQTGLSESDLARLWFNTQTAEPLPEPEPAPH